MAARLVRGLLWLTSTAILPSGSCTMPYLPNCQAGLLRSFTVASACTQAFGKILGVILRKWGRDQLEKY